MFLLGSFAAAAKQGQCTGTKSNHGGGFGNREGYPKSTVRKGVTEGYLLVIVDHGDVGKGSYGAAKQRITYFDHGFCLDTIANENSALAASIGGVVNDRVSVDKDVGTKGV